MPRITEITDDGGDPILQAAFAAERKLYGDVLNPTRMLAHRPPILAAAKQLYAAFEVDAVLPGALLALVYVKVATLNGCPF